MSKVATEIWKNVPGYEGYYEVSSIGRIRSVDHYVKHFRGDKLRKGKIKGCYITHDGYYRVHLSKCSKQKHITVHRLVALAFIPNPENKKCVNHIDGVKTNNDISNLEWCTSGENTRHFFRILGGHNITGKKKRNQKVKGKHNKSPKAVKCIEDNIEFRSISDAAKHYNVTRQSIKNWVYKPTENKTFIYL